MGQKDKNNNKKTTAKHLATKKNKNPLAKLHI